MGHPEVAAPLLVFTAAIPFISGMYVLVYALRPRLNMKYEVYVTSVIEPITVLLTGAALFSWHRSIAMAAWAHVSAALRSEEHTSELQSLMRTSYAVFCLKKKKYKNKYD